MSSTKKMKKYWLSDNTGMNLLLPILGFLLGVFLIFMVWDMAKSTGNSTKEGFASKLGRNKNNNNSGKNPKKQPKKISQSKLSQIKNGEYDSNAELRDYGMSGTGEDEDTTDDDKFDEIGAKMGENALKKIVAKSGKVDTFKDVVGNIDRIQPGAFNFRSIGSTIRRYNENFNNQLNRAREKNKNNNFEATMAQGSVLFKEFKKLFAFSEMF